jgi:hypothetical protein
VLLAEISLSQGGREMRKFLDKSSGRVLRRKR